jgi:hypothetical protein
MAAATATYRYGQAGTVLEAPGPLPQAPSRPAYVPLPTPGGVVRKVLRRAWDEEPILEATRRQLQAGAARAGISGRSGEYGLAAQRTGFSQELARIAQERELDALYANAWGKAGPPRQPRTPFPFP